MPLPVYVINLDRRPDRWQTISARLDALGIEATRIPAVDARDLPELGMALSRGLIAAAIGNMRSQAAAMRKLLESDSPAALILEDDAVLAPDTPLLLEAVGNWWPEGSHIVRLECWPSPARALHPPYGRTPSDRSIRRVSRWVAGTAAYMIDRQGAQWAAEAFEDAIRTASRSRSVDRTLFDLSVSRLARRLRPVQIFPAMAYQDGSPSDYTESRERAAPAVRRREIMWRLRRLPYNVLRYWPSLIFGKAEKVRIVYSDAPMIPKSN